MSHLIANSAGPVLTRRTIKFAKSQELVSPPRRVMISLTRVGSLFLVVIAGCSAIAGRDAKPKLVGASRAVAPSYPNNALQSFRNPISAAVYLVATLEGTTTERIGLVVNSRIDREKAKAAVEDLTRSGLVAIVIDRDKDASGGNIAEYTVTSIREFQNEWHVECMDVRIAFGSGNLGQVFHRVQVARILTGEWAIAGWTIEGMS